MPFTLYRVLFLLRLSISVYIGRMQAEDVYTAEVISSVSFGEPREECHLLVSVSAVGARKHEILSYKCTSAPVLQAEGKIVTSTIGTEREKARQQTAVIQTQNGF